MPWRVLQLPLYIPDALLGDVASLTTTIGVLWAAVGGHIRNAEIFLTTVLADIVGLLTTLIEFVVILRTFWMADAIVGAQLGNAGKTLSTVFAVEIGHAVSSRSWFK